MRANVFLSAFGTFLFKLLAEVFFRISENDFSSLLSRNWAFGLSSTIRSHLNSSYAAMANWCASIMFLATFGEARGPVKMQINYISFGPICHPVIFWKLRNGLNIILGMCRSGWMRSVIPRPTMFLTFCTYTLSTQKCVSTSPQQTVSG